MGEKPTVAQLREAIDSGRTGSKVRALDPAASPLGTDDEAGGHPPDPSVIEQSLKHETLMGARQQSDASGSSNDSMALQNSDSVMWPLLLRATALGGALGVLTILLQT